MWFGWSSNIFWFKKNFQHLYIPWNKCRRPQNIQLGLSILLKNAYPSNHRNSQLLSNTTTWTNFWGTFIFLRIWWISLSRMKINYLFIRLHVYGWPTATVSYMESATEYLIMLIMLLVYIISRSLRSLHICFLSFILDHWMQYFTFLTKKGSEQLNLLAI